MSLTQEDLKAISDLIDVKLDKQEQNIFKRLDEIRFEQVDKNILSEIERRIAIEIQEVKRATIQNSYDIAILKQKVS